MIWAIGITLLSVTIWLFLLSGWGNFWRCDQQLPALATVRSELATMVQPAVTVIIPARDEADVLPESLPSLLQQQYDGRLTILLIDDQSTDHTGGVAQAIATEAGATERLTVLPGQPLPPGWSGKLWAVEQGWQQVQQQANPPEYLLLTDADIVHSPEIIARLVHKAESERLAMVSLMVQLRCQSAWEKILIPAFVFFFQKLYPFPWVNNPKRKLAAAAGGCILLRRDALAEIGGIAALREALIDDCTLAQNVKDLPRPIWLGLSQEEWSIRPYEGLETIWNMVARTAYTQLDYNPVYLTGTLLGMAIIYVVPPLSVFGGLWLLNAGLVALGAAAWSMMAIAYWPTLKLYRRSPLWGFVLPLIAVLYNLMTFDSAWRHWRGQGGGWKGRVYPQG